MAERITAVVTTGGFEIIGNREGLLGLAQSAGDLLPCQKLLRNRVASGTITTTRLGLITPKTAHSNSPSSISPNCETEPRRIVPA